MSICVRGNRRKWYWASLNTQKLKCFKYNVHQTSYQGRHLLLRSNLHSSKHTVHRATLHIFNLLKGWASWRKELVEIYPYHMIWGRWTHWPIIDGNARLGHFARLSWSMQWSCRKCTCNPSWNFRYNSTESISLTVKGNVLLIAPAASRSGTVYCFSKHVRPRHATSIPVPHSDDDYVVRAKFRCSCHWARELSQHLKPISPPGHYDY